MPRSMCLSARLSFFSASLRRPTVFAPPLSPVLIFRLFFSLAPHTAFIGRPLSSADAPVLFSDTPLLFRHTHFSRHSTPNRRHDRSQDRYAIIAIIATSLSSPLSPRLPSLPSPPQLQPRSRSCMRAPTAAYAALQLQPRSCSAAVCAKHTELKQKTNWWLGRTGLGHS